MAAVKPLSTPEMASQKPPPVHRPGAKPPPPAPTPKPSVQDDHPALTEMMMTFARGTASISWICLATALRRLHRPDRRPPPSRARQRQPSIAELDLPDLELTGISGPRPVSAAPSTGIVAAPDDDLEFGLDLPTVQGGPGGTKVMAAPQVAPPPGFGGGPGHTSIMQAPQISQPQAAPAASAATAAMAFPAVPAAPAVEALALVVGSALRISCRAHATTSRKRSSVSSISRARSRPSASSRAADQHLGAHAAPHRRDPAQSRCGDGRWLCDVLIPANSPVPCEKTRTFMTASDNQTSVTVRVAQGSRRSSPVTRALAMSSCRASAPRAEAR